MSKAYGVPPRYDLSSAAQRVTDRDARIRGIRSFFWGLGIDVATAVVLVLLTAFTNIQWTEAYWITLGLLLAKSVLQAVVAFLARKLIPPSNL